MDIDSQKNAFSFIFSKRNGDQSELRKVMNEDVIDDFCLVGFIKQGVTSKNGMLVTTWKITSLGDTVYKSIYAPPSIEEQKMGVLCDCNIIGF